MSHDPKSETFLGVQDVEGLFTLIDPWKKLKLASPVTTDQTTLQNITALGFTPQASKDYWIDCLLLMQATNALVGPKVSWAGPTGLTDAACTIEGPTAAGVVVANSQTGIGGTGLSLATFPTANETYIVRLKGVVRVGSSPGAGTIRPQFASTVLSTDVSVRAGSILLYRTI